MKTHAEFRSEKINALPKFTYRRRFWFPQMRSFIFLCSMFMKEPSLTSQALVGNNSTSTHTGESAVCESQIAG